MSQALKPGTYGVLIEHVKKLRRAGFRVKREFHDGYKVTGKGVRGWLMPDRESGSFYDNALTVDNAKKFNKLSHCPMCVRMPFDVSVVVRHLEHLGSDAGFEAVSNFWETDENPYPFEGIEIKGDNQ